MAEVKPKEEDNISSLYAYLERELGWSESDRARRVRSHPPAHTVEDWRPHALELFPNVRDYLRVHC